MPGTFIIRAGAFGRRAHPIVESEAEKLVKAGEARRVKHGLYETKHMSAPGRTAAIAQAPEDLDSVADEVPDTDEDPDTDEVPDTDVAEEESKPNGKKDALYDTKVMAPEKPAPAVKVDVARRRSTRRRTAKKPGGDAA